jgi:nitroreductase
MALAALLSRRTIRQYDADYVVPKDVLEKIVNATLLSPTANNRQGIDLIVITNKALIDTLSNTIRDTWPQQLKDNFASRPATYGVKNVVTCDAPVLIFLVKNERSDEKFIAIDTGIVTQSILVAAREFGLDTMCLGVFLWGEPEKVEAILKIPKGSLAMAVSLGKAKPNPIVGEKTVLAKATYIEYRFPKPMRLPTICALTV